MHLAWRWFTGLGFDQEVPHHSTFSKNRERALSGIEAVRAVVRRSCGPMPDSWTRTRRQAVGRWNFR
jgi:hypothetical protein